MAGQDCEVSVVDLSSHRGYRTYADFVGMLNNDNPFAAAAFIGAWCLGPGLKSSEDHFALLARKDGRPVAALPLGLNADSHVAGFPGRVFADRQSFPFERCCELDALGVIIAQARAEWPGWSLKLDSVPIADLPRRSTRDLLGIAVAPQGVSQVLHFTGCWDETLRRVASRTVAAGTRRLTHKFTRDLGPFLVEVVESRDRDRIVGLLTYWKRMQYCRTGVPDLTLTPGYREFLLALAESPGTGSLTALRAESTPHPLSIHLGVRHRGILHWYLPAYDKRYARYSPGRLHLLTLASRLPELEIQLIDLGPGTERYKSRLAMGEYDLMCLSIDL